MMTDVIERDPESLEIGQPLRVTFEPRGAEPAVRQFPPEACNGRSSSGKDKQTHQHDTKGNLRP